MPQKGGLFAVTTLLKGVGQVMLQENAVTGFLFLLGIFWGSTLMGVAALLATLCGTATAYLLKYDKAEIRQGLYGFSAALVGVALMLFLKPVLLTWSLIVLGSAFATLVQHFFIARKIPVFTLPFVLVTWAVIWAAHTFLPATLAENGAALAGKENPFTFGFRGYGQVIFQNNLVAGGLFFVAVFISSPIAALYGFAGAVLAAMIAFWCAVPVGDIGIGLFSYNAVLSAIVFAGTRVEDGIWVLLSVVLSVFINLLLAKWNVVPLTFPFVLASCVTLFLKSRVKVKVRN